MDVTKKFWGLRSRASQFWGPHPIVGLSALCFAPPAAVQAAQGLCLHSRASVDDRSLAMEVAVRVVLCCMFTCNIVACSLADYFFILRGHRSRFGYFDIRLARLTLVVASLDFWRRNSLLETLVLVALAGLAFLFSGRSGSFNAWVFRHSLWHLVAGGILTYGALCRPSKPELLDLCFDHYLRIAAGCYAAAAALAVCAVLIAPGSLRVESPAQREGRTHRWLVACRGCAPRGRVFGVHRFYRLGVHMR